MGSSSNSLRSTKTLSMLLPSSELSSTELRPQVKPQSSPRLKVPSPTNSPSTSTSSRPTPSTSSSNPLMLRSQRPTPTSPTSSTSMRPAPAVRNPVTSTPTEMSSTPRLSSPPSIPLTSLVPSTIRSTPCSTDSRTILRRTPPFSNPTRSRPPSTPPSSRSSPRLRLPDSKLTSSRDKLTLRSSPSTLRSPSSLRLMLGSSPDNLTRMSLMPRTIAPPRKLSTTKRPTEETVNSPILSGLLTSSKSKLPPSVTLSETESMTTSTMRDSTPCSTERPTPTLRLVLMVLSTDRTREIVKRFYAYNLNGLNDKNL